MSVTKLSKLRTALLKHQQEHGKAKTAALVASAGAKCAEDDPVVSDMIVELASIKRVGKKTATEILTMLSLYLLEQEGDNGDS